MIFQKSSTDQQGDIHTIFAEALLEVGIKGLIIVGPGLIASVPFWVPDDLESCNFQNLLVFGFPEASQSLMSFRQHLFSLFHGGTKGKNLKTPEICQKSTKAIKPGPTMVKPFTKGISPLQRSIFPTNDT